MNPGLRGDDLPLDASQHEPRIGQGQIQIGDVVEAIGPADLHDVRTPLLAFGADFHQPQNPSYAPTLGQRTDADIPDRRRTPNLATVPPSSARITSWGSTVAGFGVTGVMHAATAAMIAGSGPGASHAGPSATGLAVTPRR